MQDPNAQDSDKSADDMDVRKHDSQQEATDHVRLMSYIEEFVAYIQSDV